MAAKPVFEGSVEILQEWRNMSIEDLVEWTTPGSKFQKTWAEGGPRGLSLQYRAKVIKRQIERRARREAQTNT